MPTEIIFVHCQSYARRPNRAGQCVTQVTGEGLRSGGYHSHVENPGPPIPVFGDPATFQLMHDAHVAERRTRAVKDGLIRERMVRQDRHTLFTIVASYPVPVNLVEGSSEELKRFNRWVDLTLSWVREQFGDQLKVAFAHTDETYPHLHFWLLPDDPSADATLLHPGKLAKREAEARLKADGTPPREAVAAGNRALKNAMRDWIDSYHRAVGAPLGMRRDGPKRRRLSRSQYMAEQAMLDHRKKLEEDRARLEVEVATLKKREIALTARIFRLDAAASAFMQRAERHQSRVRTEAARVAALGPMLDAVVEELEGGTIRFHPETGWKVRDATPFRAAGQVWSRLEPAIRRLVGMVQAAEDGRWTAGCGREPSPPQPTDPTPLQASL